MDLLYQVSMYLVIAYQQFVFGYLYTYTHNYQVFLLVIAFLCMTTAVALVCVFEIENQPNKKIYVICTIVFLFVEAGLVILLNAIHDGKGGKHHFHTHQRFLLVYAAMVSIGCAVALIVDLCKCC